MLMWKKRDAREAALSTIVGWNMLTQPEEVRTLLQILGYRMEVRFGHVDAVRESRTPFGDLVEDERHLFMTDELPMPCGTFLGYVQRAFEEPGYTIPTSAFPGRS
ncbi:MAG: hypothetical protein ACRDIV_17915 [Ktedonobacteraceae bacterium]